MKLTLNHALKKYAFLIIPADEIKYQFHHMGVPQWETVITAAWWRNVTSLWCICMRSNHTSATHLSDSCSMKRGKMFEWRLTLKYGHSCTDVGQGYDLSGLRHPLLGVYYCRTSLTVIVKSLHYYNQCPRKPSFSWSPLTISEYSSHMLQLVYSVVDNSGNRSLEHLKDTRLGRANIASYEPSVPQRSLEEALLLVPLLLQMCLMGTWERLSL